MDSEKARPILAAGARPAGRGAPCACGGRRSSSSPRARAKAPRTSCSASARTDPDPEVREQAVFWLSQVGSERAVGALDSILRTSTDRRLQDKAIFALSQQDSPRAQLALRTYAERADAPRGAPGAGDLLDRAERRQGERRVSPRAVRPDQGRGARARRSCSPSPRWVEQENGKWLVGVARDRAQPIEIRKQALFWAGQGDASIADLTSLYTTFDDREMKEQLIFVYSQRDETGGGGQAARDRPARPDCRAAEEGALLAGAERRSPRSQGAAGHHRATVRGAGPCERTWWAGVLAALLPAPARRHSRWPSGSDAGGRHGAAELRLPAGRLQPGTGEHHDHG